MQFEVETLLRFRFTLLSIVTMLRGGIEPALSIWDRRRHRHRQQWRSFALFLALCSAGRSIVSTTSRYPSGMIWRASIHKWSRTSRAHDSGFMSAFAIERRSGIRAILVLAAVSAGLLLSSCSEGGKPGREVVVYTSVDQFFSEPVLKDFEAATGITVRAVFDVEAAKTTGLANRLVAEKARPRADVFWNGEFVQTVRLMEQGVLAPFVPDRDAATSPAGEPQYWTSFGGRARVLIVNTNRLKPSERPAALLDLASDKWPAREIGIAYPLFGTTATHAAALYASWGPEKARGFFATLSLRGVRFVDGNSTVRDLVAAGHLSFGLTDSDDACAAKAKNLPVEVRFLDQGEGAAGTLVIPNTVALIKGAPNPEAAKHLINHLLSPQVELKLAESGWFHVDGTDVIAPSTCGLPPQVKAFPVSEQALANGMDRMQRELKELIVR